MKRKDLTFTQMKGNIRRQKQLLYKVLSNHQQKNRKIFTSLPAKEKVKSSPAVKTLTPCLKAGGKKKTKKNSKLPFLILFNYQNVGSYTGNAALVNDQK